MNGKIRKMIASIILLLVAISFSDSTVNKDTKPADAKPIEKNGSSGMAAFPGAEGFGKNSAGGRGGRVIYVTNLNDSGGGSLRAALEESGARTVIFSVGGTINLKSNIAINNPYITIAGQTATGDGITLRNGGLIIQTHDVIVRFIRDRVGDGPLAPEATSNHGILIAGNDEIYNIIVDHCSLSWAADENISTWGKVKNVTVQWCIISECLSNSIHPKGAHSCGFLVGVDSYNISIHHNLFAHNSIRNPMVEGDSSSEVINNVVYDWDTYGTTFFSDEGGALLANVIGNKYIAGNSTNFDRGIRDIEGIEAGSSVYLYGNEGPGRAKAGSGSEWNAASIESKTDFKSSTPAFEGSGIKTEAAAAAYDNVLEKAGATAPKRDTIDRRIVSDVKNKTGKIIDSPADVGGWLKLKGGAAPIDTDFDGIPDNWETSKGLNPDNAEDGNEKAPSGYTWIEEYINSLASN